MVEEVVYLGFHQEVRVRLATGALVAATCPTTASRPSTSRATRSPCTCPARARLRADPPTRDRRAVSRTASRERQEATRRELRRARRRARSSSATGFASATVGEITREAGASLGLLNYHFASKDDVVAEAFAEVAREELAELAGDLAAPRATPRTGSPRTSTCPTGRIATSWRLWIDALGRERARRGAARHARAVRRRLAGGARRGARRRGAPGPLDVRRPGRHRRRGWSRRSTASGCT